MEQTGIHLFTHSEAARRVGLSPVWFSALVSKGYIPYVEVPGKKRKLIAAHVIEQLQATKQQALTEREAGRILGVTQQRVHQLVKEGRISTMEFLGTRRVSRRSVEEYMRQRRELSAEKSSQKALTEITRDIERIREHYASFILQKLAVIREKPETEQEKILGDVLELTNKMNQEAIRISQGLLPILAEYPLSAEQMENFKELLQALDSELSFESFKNLYRVFAEQQQQDNSEA